jgi:uncharacterized protein YozE (UPF0346 family)
MVKTIPFPTNDYAIYLQALNEYQEKEYEKAIHLFNKICHIHYFKRITLNPMIDCLMQISEYERIYDLIEEAFLNEDIDEEYLLEKYIATMILDHKIDEASQLIDLMIHGVDISKNMKGILEKLKRLSKEMIRKNEIEKKMHTIEFKQQNERVNLIMNLDHINFDEYKSTIFDTLSDYQADPLIKYELLKYLKTETDVQKVNYFNGENEEFSVDLTLFEDIKQTEIVQIPPRLAYRYLQEEYPELIVDLNFIQNIWFNDYLLIYPKQEEDYHLIANQLKEKVLYLMGETDSFLGHQLLN